MGQVNHYSQVRSGHVLLLSGVVLLVVFTVYAIIPEHCLIGDNIGYPLIAASLATSGDLDLDEFGYLPDYYVHRYQGRLYSTYPIVPVLLLYPFTKLAFALNLTDSPNKVVDWVAGLWIAIACSLLFIVLCRIVPIRWALMLALGLAFASPVFSNCSSELWSHVPALVFLCLSIFLAIKPVSCATAVGLGMSCAFVLFCRSQTAHWLAVRRPCFAVRVVGEHPIWSGSCSHNRHLGSCCRREVPKLQREHLGCRNAFCGSLRKLPAGLSPIRRQIGDLLGWDIAISIGVWSIRGISILQIASSGAMCESPRDFPRSCGNIRHSF